MEQIFLIADIGRDAVLNADGLTLLRNVYLVQGTSYDVYLAFRNNGATIGALPTIANFSFTVGSLFASAFLSASGNADYPLKFTVVADSPALTAALAGKGAVSAPASLSWASGASTTVLAPFNVSVTAAVAPTGTGTGAITETTYATPTTAETKAVTASSPNGWLTDCTNTPAVFTLPDATTVPTGTEYGFKKVDSTAHTLTVNCFSGQTIKSFTRCTVSNGGQTVAISRGTFTDASLYVKHPGDSVNVTAVAGGWVTDDFSGDVV